ncbi:MAG: UTP--glucose-1-phosphate uridylyltransferase [Opitutaceae bacterium]|jgi:UDP-N-acetylglucosamine/UDP-N-acetylgalactosamine diphosphorylase
MTWPDRRMARANPLIERYAQAGQGHVFAFFETLDPAGRNRLLEQAAEVDLPEIDRLNRTLVKARGAAGVNLSGLAPAPYVPLPGNGGEAAQWARARAEGEAALRAGRVAAFTVAGGQGTRLGYDGPKGTFPVTPVKGKPLFQVFAEKIIAAGRRYGRPLHWFIMTSHQNHAASEAFFEGNGFFGLDRGRVHFLKQGRMPAVDFEGRILLDSPGAIALSPDGHGGAFRALDRSGALELMEKEGVDTLSYFQVDNPLVRCVDAAFIGWHLVRRSEMSSKMVPKAYAEEKLGHFCIQEGRLTVIEYSDLPMALQKETDDSGRLRYLAGSIAIHVLDRDFARRMARAAGAAGETLPFHRADKKVQTIDSAGRPAIPDKPNGIKFELFVFDAIRFARDPLVIETKRSDDFSPVKNAQGVDSPASCRGDQLRQFARWFAANGAALRTDPSGLPLEPIEVSPLFAYDEETFAESWSKLKVKPVPSAGLYLGG